MAVHLKPIRRQRWQNGRFAASGVLEAGHTFIADLRQNPQVLIQDPWYGMHFYLPKASLAACAEENGMPVFSDLADAPVAGLDDPVMRQLAGAAKAAFAQPHRASGLLLDALLYAVCFHVTGRHGAMRSAERGRSYGLAA